MRNFILLLCCVIGYGTAYPQHTLQEEHTFYRAGDHLLKQEIAFIAPGDSGENSLWDFSQLTVLNDGYKVTYYEYPDSLVIGCERRSLYKYILHQDTLFSTGIENPTTLIEYIKPELQLVYPVSYNDQGEDFYYGTGHYCKQIDLSISGKATYHADAYGKILLPDGDTIPNVLRIHHRKQQLEDQQIHYSSSQQDTLFSTLEIADRLLNDTIWIQTDTYRWYAIGYRYPVFETIEQYVYHHGKPSLTKTATFYYPPHEQYYGLEYDRENTALREELETENERKQGSKGKYDISNRIEDSLLEGFAYTLATEGEILYINFELTYSTEVSIQLIDMQGRTLNKAPSTWYDNGHYTLDFSTHDYPRGEYLIRIIAGEKAYTEKIMK